MSRPSARVLPSLLATSLLVMLTGCGLLRPPVLDIDHAWDAVSLEFQLDGAGRLVQIEYHIAPGSVPAAVRDAMDRLHPGAPYTGAELEFQGGQMLYELTRMVDHLEVEALFRPDGTLVAEELQIPAARAPAAVRETVEERFPHAGDPVYEEILDGQGVVREYHVKVQREGRRYKLALTPLGVLLRSWVEMPAEIEVPVDGL